jgi:capsular exopolysaccharide synthesis family protein
LYFSSDRPSHCVIQVTSPNSGDGKSILAANLAISIAQSGKRVLLIDGHLERPQQHEIFGVSQETGLGSVIASDAELDDAIRQTAVNHLWLLPTGPLPADGSEIFTSPRFAELIDVVREQYDFVILDTAPLLMVSDPSVVAPQVDGVLLVLRLTRDSRRQAKRAQEALATVHARLVGVVANGVGGVGSRGYRYDSYPGYNGYYEQGNGKLSSHSELQTALRR